MIFDFMCVLFCKLRREQCGHCDRRNLAKGCHRKQKAAEIKGSSVYKLIKTECIEHPYNN